MRVAAGRQACLMMVMLSQIVHPVKLRRPVSAAELMMYCCDIQRVFYVSGQPSKSKRYTSVHGPNASGHITLNAQPNESSEVWMMSNA